MAVGNDDLRRLYAALGTDDIEIALLRIQAGQSAREEYDELFAQHDRLNHAICDVCPHEMVVAISTREMQLAQLEAEEDAHAHEPGRGESEGAE